jgi:hypothetical protein
MLFELTFPCYLTTFSGKKCLSGKVICAFFPAYRSSPVFLFVSQKFRGADSGTHLRIMFPVVSQSFGEAVSAMLFQRAIHLIKQVLI